MIRFLFIRFFCVHLREVEASWRRVLRESQANDKIGLCIVSVYRESTLQVTAHWYGSL